MKGAIIKTLKLALITMSALAAFVGGETLIDHSLINPMASAIPSIIGTILHCYALFITALIIVKASGIIYRLPSRFKKVFTRISRTRANYERCKLCLPMFFIIASPIMSHVLWSNL
ncbi:hypothetical protein [Spirochaeta cellobiosiphila]|uniref:hypothetical protein n=1 Tax=Spirochaeta cellobiosiphila TaxID=504483 RepID=UPI00048D4C45|nr:hypothetical protein [Spirochaeta cellobiosiphila]